MFLGVEVNRKFLRGGVASHGVAASDPHEDPYGRISAIHRNLMPRMTVRRRAPYVPYENAPLLLP